MSNRYSSLAQLYRDALLTDVVPFWERCSPDLKNGGYFTCLDRAGKVYDSDKFVALQAREAWLFSLLYNTIDKQDRWLAQARRGIQFLQRHGRDRDGNWYVALTADGRPLIQPCDLRADAFVARAMSEFAIATGDETARALALDTYRNVLCRQDQPEGKYSRHVPNTRPVATLRTPIMVAMLTYELRDLLDEQAVSETCHTTLSDLLVLFRDRRNNVLLEHVPTRDVYEDSSDIRRVIPGHGFEACRVIMTIAEAYGETAPVEQAVEVLMDSVRFAWDESFGGLPYCMDVKGAPLDEPEWDRKLWWVHLEALVALAMAFRLTGNETCWAWYERVHDYTWARFPDREKGEWYGYLSRRGNVLLPIKGGARKGCCYAPESLYRCMRELEQIDRKAKKRPDDEEEPSPLPRDTSDALASSASPHDTSSEESTP